MSNRSTYRSRSVFDERKGGDPSYQAGQGLYGFSSDLYRLVVGDNDDYIIPRTPRRWSGKRGHQEEVARQEEKDYGVQAMAIRRAGRRRVGRRGHMRRGSSRRRATVSAARRAGRTRSRSRFRTRSRRARSVSRGRRGARNVALQRLRNVGGLARMLSRPLSLRYEEFRSLNAMGNSMQGFCSWQCKPLFFRPDDIDAHFVAQYANSEVKIDEIRQDFTFYMEQSKVFMQWKNMCNRRIDVTVWKLYPKMDIGVNSVTFDTLMGTNPEWIQNAFGEPIEPVGAVRQQAYDEHNADLFRCPIFKDLFKVVRVTRRFLEPGAFFVRKYAWRKGHITRKGKDDVRSDSSYALTWQHKRWMGPLILTRVQGSQVHDESKIPNFGTGGVMDNTSMDPTFSGYNCETYQERISVSRTMPAFGSQSSSAGELGAALSTYPSYLNEQGWEIRVPQEDHTGP